MRRILILCGLFLTGSAAISQSLDDINDLMGKMQYREAKAGIDKYLSNAKKANDLLNWKANYTVEDAIVHAWNWEKKLAENA